MSLVPTSNLRILHLFYGFVGVFLYSIHSSSSITVVSISSAVSFLKEMSPSWLQSVFLIVAFVLEFVSADSRVRVVLSLRSGLVLSLVVCGGVGPSTASLANQAPVFCGCPAGTHGCDLVSRVRLDQSANPVVVWLGLVSRVCEVIVEAWNMRKTQQFARPHFHLQCSPSFQRRRFRWSRLFVSRSFCFSFSFV